MSYSCSTVVVVVVVVVSDVFRNLKRGGVAMGTFQVYIFKSVQNVALQFCSH